jgi:hypothetical protein
MEHLCSHHQDLTWRRQTQLMGNEMDLELSVIFKQPTGLIAREHFTKIFAVLDSTEKGGLSRIRTCIVIV